MESGRVHDDAAEPARAVVGSVENALRMLALFRTASSFRVADAVTELGISRSTAHRLLRTMVASGFIEHDPATRTYGFGPVLTQIGATAAPYSDVRDVGRALMTSLAEATRETTHLGVLRGASVLYLDSVESTQTVRTASRAGWRLPSHLTAAGKILLAELSEAEVRSIYPDDLIRDEHARRIVSRADLLAELELVRARGFATNDGESEPDVSSVAVALRDDGGRARAAVAVTAPRSRASEAWVRSAGDKAARLAREHILA